MRKVISNTGEEFYIKFGRGYLYININLYKKNKKKLFNIFTTYKRVETVEIPNTYKKTIRDISLNQIKLFTNKAIENYYTYHKNIVDYDEWDGYLGGEGARKTEIMRNKKIKELLDGNTSKLEDYLNG